MDGESRHETSGSWTGGSGVRSWPPAASERAQERGYDAERYELSSNASDGSWWWWGDSWDSREGSWDGSSGCNRSNWVYVSRSDDRLERSSDPWHRWHGSDRDWNQGRRVRSGDPELAAFREGIEGGQGDRSGDSEGDDHGKGDLPSGRVTSVHEKADKDDEKRTQGKISSSYPPVFKARQGESYRDWKRSVKFWLRGEGQQLPYHLVGPRVMVQLRDRAAALVKHLEPEDVDCKNGLDVIFQTLEKSPLIRQSEKNRVDWHRKRLLNLSRLSGESMESYITRASLYRSQLEGLDATLSMGERFFVGHLMDHARLTRRDKAMVKTHAGDETEDNITSALVDLAGELEGEAGYPIGQSESQLSHTQGEEHLVQRGFMGMRYGKRDKAALIAEVNDDVATLASVEAIPEEVEGADGDDSMDEEPPLEVLHAEHEALALQFKAKQKMAEVRKMRNYFRRGEGDSKKGKGKCFVCDEVGHFARDCPKVKNNGGTVDRSNQVLMTTSKTEEAKEEWDLLASLCKDTIATASTEKAAYMVQGVLGGVAQHGTHVTPFETWWNMQELARKVILDLGCMRNVVGVTWANDVITEWKKEGRWLNVISESEVFRFGNGETLKSKFRLQLEATFGGKRVLLAFSVVSSACPPLLSKQSHTALGVQLDTTNHTMSSKKLGIKRYGLTENSAGHYTVRIDEFDLVPSLEQCGVNDLRMDVMAEVATFVHPPRDAAFDSQARPDDTSSPNTVNVCRLQSTAMSTLRRDGSSDESMSPNVRGRGWQLPEGPEGGHGAASSDAGGCSDEGMRVGDPSGSASREVTQGGAQEHGCGPQGKRQRTTSSSGSCHATQGSQLFSRRCPSTITMRTTTFRTPRTCRTSQGRSPTSPSTSWSWSTRTGRRRRWTARSVPNPQPWRVGKPTIRLWAMFGATIWPTMWCAAPRAGWGPIYGRS